MRWPCTVVLLLATLRIGSAEVLGGGLASTDCRMVFRGVTTTNPSSGVVCTDGDPACDRDGVADGTCRFAVELCTGTPEAACQTTPLSQATVAGLALAPPDLPAANGTCGDPLAVAVPSGSTTGATVLARDDTSLRDVDYLNLCCVSGVPTPLDAARCAVAVDLRASGCPAAKISRRARLLFGRAREAVAAFAADPSRPQALGRALKHLAVVRGTAQRVARRDQCGDALGLMMRYAQDAVSAARAAGTVTAR
jgi:hypothetical protein